MSRPLLLSCFSYHIVIFLDVGSNIFYSTSEQVRRLPQVYEVVDVRFPVLVLQTIILLLKYLPD